MKLSIPQDSFQRLLRYSEIQRPPYPNNPQRVIYYDFMTTFPENDYTGDPRLARMKAGFSAFTPDQRAAVAAMFGMIEAITPLRFKLRNSTQGDPPYDATWDIRYGNTALTTIENGVDSGKRADGEIQETYQFQNGIFVGTGRNDVLINVDRMTVEVGRRAPNDGYLTLVHETLHALGLSHPFVAGNNLEIHPTNTLYLTSMAYERSINLPGDAKPTDLNRAPSGLQMLDIQALQALYGQGISSSGNTTYVVAQATDLAAEQSLDAIRLRRQDFESSQVRLYSNERISLFDTGGSSDVIDAGVLTSAIDLDLSPGSLSTLGQEKYNLGIPFGVVVENARAGRGNDTILGNDATNTLEGNGGNDSLNGGNGADTLYGGVQLGGTLNSTNSSDGKDTLDGGGADNAIDTLVGGSESDTYHIYAGGARDIIRDSGQNLILGHLASGGPPIPLSNFFTLRDARLGANAWITPDRKIKVEHNSPYTLTDIGNGISVQFGETESAYQSGDFGITTHEAPTIIGKNNTANNTAGNDSQAGTSGNDRMRGLAGRDTLYGYVTANAVSGDDWIEGGDDGSGPGGDFLYGGDGADTLFGNNAFGDGSAQATLDGIAAQIARTTGASTALGDLLSGETGDDVLIGGDGINFLAGGAGGDLIVGGAGLDYIFGGRYVTSVAANWAPAGGGLNFEPNLQSFEDTSDSGDAIYAGAGNDQVFGGLGDDYIDLGSGSDLGIGGAGNDVLLGGTNAEVVAGDQDDVLFGDARPEPTDTQIMIDAAELLHGADFLDGGTGWDVLLGGGGGDILLGGSGNDWLYGDGRINTPGVGAGYTAVGIPVQGADYLDGGDGNDTLYGDGGSDTLFGRNDNDYLDGGEGGDTLDGGAGVDVLYGRAGDDTLIGGTGNDDLRGGFGKDTYVFNRGDGADTLHDEDDMSGATTSAAAKSVIVLGAGIARSDVVFRNSSLRIDLGQGDSIALEMPAGQTDPASSQVLDSLQFADGSAMTWNDILAQGFEFDGTSGNDTLTGSSVGDRLRGYDGNDTLYGYGGNNLLDGGTGGDTLVSEAGSDTLIGGEGDDWLGGGSGDDLLQGGAGSDTYVFGIGDGGNWGRDTIDEVPGGVNTLYFQSMYLHQLTFARNGNDVTIGRDDAPWSVLLRGAYSATTGGLVAGWNLNLPSSGAPLSLQTFAGMGPLAAAANTTDLTNQFNIRWRTYYATTSNPPTDTLSGGPDNYGFGTAGGAAVPGRVVNGGDGDDTLTMNGNSREVYSRGVPGNLLFGDAGDDTLTGAGDDDVLVGGAGNDLLDGRAGEDHYVMFTGTGVDTIIDRGGLAEQSVYSQADWAKYIAGVGGTDRVYLPNGVTQANLTYAWSDELVNVERNAAALHGITSTNLPGFSLSVLTAMLTITWGSGASSQSVKIAMPHSDDPVDVGIEELRFDNGTAMTRAQLIAAAGAHNLDPNAAGTSITGSNVDAEAGDDNLTGLASGGILRGGEGNDSITGGAGRDAITGDEGADTLSGGIGADLLGFGVREFIGAGNVYRGGVGNDIVLGTRSSDTYLFDAGDGSDSIGDYWHNPTNSPTAQTLLGTGNSNWTNNYRDVENYFPAAGAALPTDYSGFDTLRFGAGIVPSQVGFVRATALSYSANPDPAPAATPNPAGDDLVLTLGGNDQVRLVNWYKFTGGSVAAGYNRHALTSVEFADGTMWNSLYLEARANTQYAGTPGPDSPPAGGSGADWMSGVAGNDTLNGGDGNDLLIGGANNDTLIGGTGVDTADYSGAANAVTANLAQGQAASDGEGGSDSLSGIENLTGGRGNDTLTGDSLVNMLDGGGGNDSLNGDVGADTMTGGKGDDTFFVENANDVVNENAGEGNDTAQSLITFDLTTRPYVENVTLTGTANLNATGNGADNRLIGNTGINNLSGGAGNDFLDGGAGGDAMTGGTGDDTFVVDSIGDTVTENPGEGNDTVQSSITFALTSRPDIENVTLTGVGNIDATGNAAANRLIGNAGVNVLFGGAGADTLQGGGGNDRLTGDALDTALYSGGQGDYVVVNYLDDTWVLDRRAGQDGFDQLTGNFTLSFLGSQTTRSVVGARNGLDYIAAYPDLIGTMHGLTLELATTLSLTTVEANGFNHLKTNGVAEGRTITFDAQAYYAAGSDALRAAYTNTTGAVDLRGLALHYIRYGSNEGLGAILNGDEGSDLVRGGNYSDRLDGRGGADNIVGGTGHDEITGGAGDDVIDGGAGIFIDTAIYTGNRSAYNVTWSAAQSRFIVAGPDGTDSLTGVELLRFADSTTMLAPVNSTAAIVNDFRVYNYLAANLDLMQAYGADTIAATIHYFYVGWSEGRATSGFDAIGYLASNADLLLVYGANLNAATEHYVRWGRTENPPRLTNTFDAAQYLANYGDLTGITLTNAAAHYVYNGFAEGRTPLKLVYTGTSGNDTLTGNAANNTMTGAAGNDTITGGIGADSLTGGAGNDTYWLNRGDGADTIVEIDSTAGNTDVARFGSDISANQIWFRKVNNNNDLEASVIGTSDRFTFKDWYSGSANHVEKFMTGGDTKTLLDSQVDALVSAMSASGVTMPALNTFSLSGATYTNVVNLIGTSWQSQ